MGKVSIVKSARAPSDAEVAGLVKKAVDLVGGIKSFVKKGDVVALKPNQPNQRTPAPSMSVGVIPATAVCKARKSSSGILGAYSALTASLRLEMPRWERSPMN